MRAHGFTDFVGDIMLRLIGKLAYLVGYIVGTIKWHLGIYVRIDDRREMEE